jgi:hypothetical protein
MEIGKVRMNSQLYLGLVASENLIKNFALKVNLPNAVVGELGSNLNQSIVKDWKWRTARRASYTDFPEDSVAPLLREHEFILNELNCHRHESHVYVAIICQYGENEFPRGFSFSQETIELLAQFGASLEIDSVSVMSPPEI